jgi:glycosyltransferase involved in cell wall biosynthesis
MKISVIIPVYNADKHITKAVESALMQPETGEVVLNEDGSPGNDYEVCSALAEKYDRVSVYRHEGGVNKGIGASRNLGIEKSTFPVISFMDADDYFLKNAYKKSLPLLMDPNIDGVHSAVKNVPLPGVKVLRSDSPLSGMTEVVPPEKMFEALVNGGYRCFDCDGFIFKRSLLKKSGNFNPNVPYKEDVELWIRMAATGNLVAADLINPVAVYQFHIGNSTTYIEKTLEKKRLMWKELLKWARNNISSDKEKMKLLYIRIAAEYFWRHPDINLFWPFTIFHRAILLVIFHPAYLISTRFHKMALKSAFLPKNI